MKYSIVMPTYITSHARWDVVGKAIESINNHKTKDSEFIIVSDGSPIDVKILLDECDILIHRKQNKGIAPSWNDGVRIARGEYIVIVNDDITVQHNWLDKLRQAIELLEDEGYLAISAPGVEGQSNGTAIEEDTQWFPGYCFMLPRKVLDTIGLFDEQFVPFNFEDTDYWTRVLQAGGKLIRNYDTTITHLGGHTLHTLKYDEVNALNKTRFIAKHGFDPIPCFYYGEAFPWERE